MPTITIPCFTKVGRMEFQVCGVFDSQVHKQDVRHELYERVCTNVHHV